MPAPEEKTEIKSASVGVTPGSITISAPSHDLDYVGSGSVVISGSASSFGGVSASQSFSWRVYGLVESELESSWRVGDGEYYWYRVEGECGEVTCDNFGVQYANCKRMTFTTVISARTIAEVCENMQAPVINPAVQARIISIKRYSRPAGRTANPLDCNILEDEDFCYIPECLDYCIYERAVIDIPLRAYAIESVYQVEGTGGISLSGNSSNDSRLNFTPFYPVINFVGGCSFSVAYYFSSFLAPLDLSALSGDGVEISGSAEYYSDHYVYEASGSLQFGGSSQNVSPSWQYPRPDLIGGSGETGLIGEEGFGMLTEEGLLWLSESFLTGPMGGVFLGGGFAMGYFFAASGSSAIEGESDFSVLMAANSSGSIEIGGSAMDVSSPSYQYYPSGSVYLSGSSELNFEDLGVILTNIRLASSAFGFGFDFDTVPLESSLTISQSAIVGTCGCQSAGLALTLVHNLSESSVLSAFLDRSGASLPSTLYLRHRSSDSSWREVRRLTGRDETGDEEEVSLFFGLECVSSYWRFSFIARSKSSGRESKLVMEIPPDLVCGNNLSADIRADISTGSFTASQGDQFYVVTPHSIRPQPVEASRGIDLTVDGVPNGYVVYYDDMGLFNDEYWTDFPLEFSINPSSRKEMPVMNLSSIF
jgi:hypothetical protein